MLIRKKEGQENAPVSEQAQQPKRSRAARVFGAFKRNPGKLVLSGGICLFASWVGMGIYFDRVEENRGYNSGKSELVL